MDDLIYFLVMILCLVFGISIVKNNKNIGKGIVERQDSLYKGMFQTGTNFPIETSQFFSKIFGSGFILFSILAIIIRIIKLIK